MRESIIRYKRIGKISVDTIAIISLWIAIVPIYYFPTRVWLGMKIFGELICGLYILLNVKKTVTNKMLFVVIYSSTIFFSALINKNSMYAGNFLIACLYAALVFEIFAVFEIVSSRKSTVNIAKSSLIILFPYWILTFISVILQGSSNFSGTNAFFVGNKFNAIYLTVLVAFLLGIVCQKNSKKEIRFKLGYWIFYVVAIFMALYTTAYTGFAMLLVVLVLYLINNVLVPHKVIPMSFARLDTWLLKPFIIIACVILSGVVVIFANAFISIPRVTAFLSAIGKTNTMNSRLIIYTYLKNIIESKPLFGYGYDTSVVTLTYAENAQNGLMKVIIEGGFVGAIVFILVVYSRVKRSKKASYTIKNNWILYWIFAYIISAIIEITYNVQFLSILALYAVQCRENLEYDL